MSAPLTRVQQLFKLREFGLSWRRAPAVLMLENWLIVIFYGNPGLVGIMQEAQYLEHSGSPRMRGLV